MEVYEYVPIIAEVFAGVTIIPALALSIASFVHLNKGHDPVRSGFKWLSVSSLCLFLYAVLDLAQDLVLYHGEDIRAYSGLSGFTSLFRGLMFISLIITVVKLGSGHLQLWDHAPRLRKGVTYAAYGFAGVLTAMAVAYAISCLVFQAGVRMESISHYRAFSDMMLACNMIVFVLVLAALAWCAYVFRVSRKTQRSGKTPLLLLVAAVVLGFTHIVIFTISIVNLTYFNPDSVSSVVEYYRRSLYLRVALFLVLMFLEFFGHLAVISVLYAAGKRTEGGLWSSGPVVAGDSASDIEKQQRQGQGGAN